MTLNERSLGITALELSKGEAPYQRLQPLKIMKNILDKPPPEPSSSMSPEFRDFIKRCLQKVWFYKNHHQDPRARPDAKDLLSHPFMALRDREKLRKIIAALPPLEERLRIRGQTEALRQVISLRLSPYGALYS